MTILKKITLFCLVALFIFMSGCGSAREGRTTISFWGMGTEGERVKELIPEFERTHPNIHVVVQQIPWTAAHEKLLTAYAGESTPDVCQLGNTWLPEFAMLKALEPLDPWMRNSSLVQLDDFFEGVLQTNIIDSTLYGIPWYVDTRVLFYRHDLLREAGYNEPPKTWNEMLRLCAIVKEQAAKQGMKRYPLFMPTNEWVPAIVLGMQAGGDLLRDNKTRGNFSGQKYRKAFQLMSEIYRKEYSPSGMQLIINLYNSFSDGLVCMYITGPWNIGEFSQRVSPEVQSQWMTAPLPSMDSISPGVSLPLGTSLVIFHNSRHKDAAAQLIEFLASREQSLAFYKITGNLPPRKSAWTDTSLANNRYIQAFYRQLQRLAPLPQVPEWEQIVIKLQLYVEYIATNTMSVDEALRRFDSDVDRMLEKRRWMVENGRIR